MTNQRLFHVLLSTPTKIGYFVLSHPLTLSLFWLVDRISNINLIADNFDLITGVAIHPLSGLVTALIGVGLVIFAFKRHGGGVLEPKPPSNKELREHIQCIDGRLNDVLSNQNGLQETVSILETVLAPIKTQTDMDELLKRIDDDHKDLVFLHKSFFVRIKNVEDAIGLSKLIDQLPDSDDGGTLV